MSHTSTSQSQAELLQHIAAIHEHRPGHRRDLSIEAMTKDLDGITANPNILVNGHDKSHKTSAYASRVSSALNGVTRGVLSDDAAVPSSSIAGVAGSQQGC